MKELYEAWCLANVKEIRVEFFERVAGVPFADFHKLHDKELMKYWREFLKRPRKAISKKKVTIEECSYCQNTLLLQTESNFGIVKYMAH